MTTYRDFLQKEKRWSKRVLVVLIYHNNMLLAHKGWRVRDTSRKLGISVGATSESIKLANGLLKYPEIEVLNRKEALAFMKAHDTHTE